MSGGPGAWVVAIGTTVGVLGVPLTAYASHPKPGSEVPWALLVVAAVVVFVAAWALTVFFERRQKQRSEPREHTR